MNYPMLTTTCIGDYLDITISRVVINAIKNYSFLEYAREKTRAFKVYVIGYLK